MKYNIFLFLERILLFFFLVLFFLLCIHNITFICECPKRQFHCLTTQKMMESNWMVSNKDIRNGEEKRTKKEIKGLMSDVIMI
jgi:hypothetical protein